MALDEVTAGNVATFTSVFTAASTPSPEPTAVVCVTTNAGTLVGTLVSPDVTVDGVTVTVVASWTIPDTQDGGVYVATIDLSGSFVAADEHTFRVVARRHTDPHV